MGYIKTIGMAVLVAVVAGCGTQMAKQQTPEEIVAPRADAYWQALVKGELETAYGYLSPATRELKSLRRFKQGIHGVGRWSHAAVTKVECEEQRCLAWMKVNMRLLVRKLSKVVETSDEFYQTWLFDPETENWWLVP